MDNSVPKSKSVPDGKAGKVEAGGPDTKNRGWPKGKKRYPKSPGAPKQPLSGYVHFLNDRREAVRKECPDMSFADISKTLANEWSHLDSESKRRYAEKAEQDKERYSREFSEYQQTDAYKEFVARQQEDKSGGPVCPSKKAKKAKKVDSGTSNSVSDVAIFRDDFLDLNKAREAELRQLRRQASEFEEQNAVLQKHVDSMKSAVGKLEADMAATKDNSCLLERQLDSLRHLIEKHFGHVKIPNFGPPTAENVDNYAARLHELCVTRAADNAQLLSAAKLAAANIDMSSFPVK